MEEAAKDRGIYTVLRNPYGLNPNDALSGPDEPDLQTVKYDKVSQNWVYPFIMAGINTKVVRRSNALAGFPYGKDFRYDESSMGGRGVGGRMKSTMIAMGLGAMLLAKPGSFAKKMADRILPDPGEGPSKSERESGYYKILFFTTLHDGGQALATVTGDRDPGYGSTSKMLAESAICLAKDDLPNVSGMLTPAVAMGDALLERLTANAGLTFDFELR